MKNVEMLPEKIERLESVFLRILYLKPEERIVAPDMGILGDLKRAINNIFDENTCINVIYTLNTDKPYFGIKINPAIGPKDATIILATDEKVKLNKYQIEFDSRLFDIGLSDSELAALTIYEISEMMDNSYIFDNVRAAIDYNIITSDNIINIRDSVNYAQLIIFAIKDTMYKFASVLFKENPDDLLANSTIAAFEAEDYLLSAREKIVTSLAGEAIRTSNPSILVWMFTMCVDISHNSEIIKDTLKDARDFTASKLDLAEIDKTLNSLSRVGENLAFTENTNLNKFFDKANIGSVNEISIFKNLKRNGLRGIENELYEFAMRVKNCNDADTALLIIRSINSRIGILEDYIYQEKLSDYDYEHWMSVINQYKKLRADLSSKKFKGKSYGLFIDYDQLDKLDHPDGNTSEE